MIYLGDAWPDKYRGALLMNNIHGQRLNVDRLEPEGSGYVGTHAPDNTGRLFNGSDLTGWSGSQSLWRVEDGEIIGRSDGLRRNEWLVSDLAAEDVRLSLEVKLVDNAGNSGVQFRSEATDDSVRGYQADIGAGWWGKLCEEHGRKLLWDESGERHLRPGEWNRYEIEARGSRIRTFLNGNLCVDLDDPDGNAIRLRTSQSG